MATINLGSIKFKWQGAYNGATAYTVDDVVSYNGSSYICILASTGNLPTNATYWEQMAQAGTDGTDLTSTLTTQGDIVYRDASGLARLGAGTSGQVLQTGGTGANPSWTTMSSDVVKVLEATGGGTSTLAVDDCFSSTYENYLITANIGLSGTGTNVYLRTQDSNNAEVSSADYYYVGYQASRTQSASGGDIKSDWGDTQYRPQENTHTSTSEYGQWTIWVGSPFLSNKITSMQIHFTGYDGNSMRTVHSMLQERGVASRAGIRFLTANGTSTINTDSKVKVYGLK